MSNIAMIFIIIGVVIAIFSNLLVFKPLKKQIINLEKYNFNNNKEGDGKIDEDFLILINMTKKIVYTICIIFIFIGIIIYSFFS